MDKKRIGLVASLAVSSVFATTLAIANEYCGDAFKIANSATSYTLTLNKTTNKIYTGSDVLQNSDVHVQTSLGNDIEINVDGISDPSTDYWQRIAAGGTITFKTKVSGIKSIQVYASSRNSYTIYTDYYMSEESELNFIESSKLSVYTNTSSTGTPYSFSDPYPNYLKLVFGTNTNIYSINVNYCCSESENHLSTLRWSSNNESYGIVAQSDTVLMAEGESRRLYAQPKLGYKFAGWYEGNVLVSSDNLFTYTMADSGVKHNLVARFQEMSSAEKTEYNEKMGITLVNNSDWVYYGCYPQTLGLSNTLNKDDYKYFENLYKTTSLRFSIDEPVYYNGDYYVRNDIFGYYKLERVKWRYISKDSTKGTKIVISSRVLTGGSPYKFNSKTGEKERTPWGETTSATVYANNYKYSDIRIRLNTTLLGEIFNLSRDRLLTTAVNNAASTTQDSSNIYACENTSNDYICLPSYEENQKDNDRFKRATDYAKATGIYYNSNDNDYAVYWTRSPYHKSGDKALEVEYDATYYSRDVNSVTVGVAPMITVRY